MPSIVFLLAVWFLSLTAQWSKCFPHVVQVKLFYSFGCYLMSLMLLKVFVLRKFLWFFEFVNFLYYFSQHFAYSQEVPFPPYRIKLIFVADCFNRRSSCFWYYEFSFKIFWFLCIIAHFCCCFCFFCKLSQYITI